MLKDPRYRKKTEAFLRICAPRLCKTEKDSVYAESEYNLTENSSWEVPPEEDNRNTEENSNEAAGRTKSDSRLMRPSAPEHPQSGKI